MIYLAAGATLLPLALLLVFLLTGEDRRVPRPAVARLQAVAGVGRITIEHGAQLERRTRRAALRGVVTELHLLLRAARAAATWRATVERPAGARALLTLLRVWPGLVTTILVCAPRGSAAACLRTIEDALLDELLEAVEDLPETVEVAARDRVAASRRLRAGP